MKIHALQMSNFPYPGALVQFLENEGLAKGDILMIKTEEKKSNSTMMATIFVVGIAIVYLFHKAQKERREDGEKILDELFKNKTVEEIEDGIMDEYGIKIEIEQKEIEEEKKDWSLLSSQKFLAAYAVDEPEYTDADVKEPNPEYKVWKEK